METHIGNPPDLTLLRALHRRSPFIRIPFADSALRGLPSPLLHWPKTCIFTDCCSSWRQRNRDDMSPLPEQAQTSCSMGEREPDKPTILLVEDESVVRDVTRQVLEYAGYRVLESDGPEEALRLGHEHRGRIGLLLSDVVMPGMTGPELALRLQRLQPGLITVFMSGYADRRSGETAGARHPARLHPEALQCKRAAGWCRGGAPGRAGRK